MKTIALAVGSILAAAAPLAMGQDNSEVPYPYDPHRVERQQQLEAWRYERPYYDNRWRDERWRDDRRWREERRWRDDRYAYRDHRYDQPRRECWNPRAGHFEEDRPGEFQNDLDYSRCRPLYWR